MRFLESGVDDAVGLHGGDGDVGEPEAAEDAGGDGLDGLGAAQLAADGGGAPQEQDQNGDTSLGTENGHGETQAVKEDGLFLVFAQIFACFVSRFQISFFAPHLPGSTSKVPSFIQW